MFRPSAELEAAVNAMAVSCAAALASRSNCSMRLNSAEAAAALVATEFEFKRAATDQNFDQQYCPELRPQ